MADEPPKFPGADTSLAAVFALLFGLIPFVPGAGIAAVVFGIVGLRAVRSGRPGKGMAIAGIVLGALGTVMCCGPSAIVLSMVRSLGASDDDKAIYEIDVATRTERLVIDMPGLDACPAYLADGSSIVYEHAEPGRSRFLGGDTDLYVLSPGGTPEKLTSLPGGEHSPSVGPLTGTIAFVHHAPDGSARIGRITQGQGEPEIIEASETREHLLGARWDPLERGFAVTRNPRLGAALRLYWFDLDTLQYDRFTATEGLGDTSETDPVWTSDGFFFAYKRSVIWIDPDDKELKTVLEDTYVTEMLFRNGRLLIVAEPGKKAKGIYEATLRNGKLELKPFLAQDTGCLDISPDASRVVFSRASTSGTARSPSP